MLVQGLCRITAWTQKVELAISERHLIIFGKPLTLFYMQITNKFREKLFAKHQNETLLTMKSDFLENIFSFESNKQKQGLMMTFKISS